MADSSQRSRSVYIGNLPFDIKEEDLKKVFSQVGTVISLRMPNDPESGRSRGFAFCEYREQESVNQAIKHFSGYDLSGRKIRVDSAANNQDKDAKVSGPVNNDSQFGEPCDPVKAPEIIANIIGKMSPQQIQSIINETKRSLQCDPDEARTALVNNPQMAYALLLALVRGRYITKERGTEAMVKPDPPLLPLFPEARPAVKPAPLIPIPAAASLPVPLSGPSLLGHAPGSISRMPVPLLSNNQHPGPPGSFVMNSNSANEFRQPSLLSTLGNINSVRQLLSSVLPPLQNNYGSPAVVSNQDRAPFPGSMVPGDRIRPSMAMHGDRIPATGLLDDRIPHDDRISSLNNREMLPNVHHDHSLYRGRGSDVERPGARNGRDHNNRGARDGGSIRRGGPGDDPGNEDRRYGGARDDRDQRRDGLRDGGENRRGSPRDGGDLRRGGGSREVGDSRRNGPRDGAERRRLTDESDQRRPEHRDGGRDGLGTHGDQRRGAPRGRGDHRRGGLLDDDRRPSDRTGPPPESDHPENRNLLPSVGNSSAPIASPRPNDGPASTPATSKEEQEKAELIMQVLRLREEDIVKMAPDQQRTVRMLRDQFKNISK